MDSLFGVLRVEQELGYLTAGPLFHKPRRPCELRKEELHSLPYTNFCRVDHLSLVHTGFDRGSPSTRRREPSTKRFVTSLAISILLRRTQNSMILAALPEQDTNPARALRHFPFEESASRNRTIAVGTDARCAATDGTPSPCSCSTCSSRAAPCAL